MANPWANFSGVFLALLLVCGVLSVFFLLYFNRVIASILSYAIRAYTWHTYRIHLDIQALQVSLLGGRVFFTGLRYHGENETILIQHGHITWSYWLWRVRDVNLGNNKGDKKRDAEDATENENKSLKLRCRINAKITGLEWFIYNRSPVYDSILVGMRDSVNKDEEKPDESHDGLIQPRQRLQKASQKIEEQLNRLESKFSGSKNDSKHSNGEKTPPSPSGHRLKASPSTLSDAGECSATNHDYPLWLQLLPIHFQCTKSAVVMGNENTKGILIIKAKSLAGDVDASGCQTPDPYRQIFKIQFEHPVVEMRDNENHKDDQLTRAVKDKQTALNSGPIPHRSFFRRQRRRVLGQLRNLVPYWRSSVESFSVNSRSGTAIPDSQVPGFNHWQGLSRYLNDNDEDDKIRWSSVEYAAESTLVDSPQATLTIFWDVPGKVSQIHELAVSQDQDHHNNVNGAAPPAWAINLAVKGGVINYGPWADRYRAELQAVFNPSLYKDAQPAKKLPVGADRVPTQFKFFLEIDSEVTLKIPTREDSKNWRWKKEAAELRQHRNKDLGRDKGRNREKPPTTAAEQRPYGWLEVKVGPNATISYSMDMMASSAGYTNTLSIELPSTEVYTSVNHGLLWRSGALRIVADMSFPLKWNALRTWKFDIDGDGLELFILRDHIFLLTDLIDDWGSGPPVDYLLFTPFKYLMSFQLRNLKLYINVNDVNIINNPTDFDENAYLVLSSPCLKADTCIALDRYRPNKNAVPFNVQAEALSLSLHVPPWNTQATFLASKDLGHVENLALGGSYHYNATTSTANTDTLVLNVSGQSPVVTLYGFMIRYFLQLKDNYFGDHVHFKTLDEYQEMLRLKTNNPDAEAASKPPHKKSNDMDVILSVRVDDPKILLPANLYSAKRHVIIEGPLLSADLRFTNYYMDLDVTLSPLSFSLGSDDDGGATSPTSATSSTQMFIDGLGVYGHRLFGLPPTEPTYLCNWDLSLGAITGECTAEFLTALLGGGKAFGFSFDDDENALIPYSSIVMYDVTFLRLSVQSIRLWLHVEEAAFLFSTGQIDVDFNDWARTHYSRRANIKVPDLQIACVDSDSAARHKTRLHSPVETEALLRTSINFALIGRKHDFAKQRHLQQELIRREDQRTHRTEFLLLPGLLNPCLPDAVDPPAQSVPEVPQPVTTVDTTDEKRSIWSQGSSQRFRSLRHRSSFLSSSSGSSSGVVRPGSTKSAQRFGGSRKASNASGQQPGDLRPHMHEREYSASTGRHSAFYSAHGDYADRRDMSHNTVAFSSQFFAPYFPLDHVHPDSKEATMQSIEVDDDVLPEKTPFGLEDIDPELLSQDAAYQSFLIELPSGISTFLNATSLRHIASLLDALQPPDPEDILDNLQTSAMSNIFDMQNKAKITGSIEDIVVRIPHANIRFLNCSDLDSPEPSQEEQDQYDISFTKVAFAARSETRNHEPDANDSPKPRVSFHLRLDSVGVSAAERFAHMDETQAAVRASIEDLVVSMGSKDVVYFDGDVGALRASSSSGKVEYLAALVHRTNVLAAELGALYSATSKRGDQRIKLFTYRLMTQSPAAADPSFIVRPSAVLRAATEQLRTYDSWKLMSRMRQMWCTLNSDAKEQLKLECIGCTSAYPDDVRQTVTKAFKNWRSWDLDHLEDAELMNIIFGKPSDGQRQSASDQTQLMAVVRLGEADFVLDPGPKQNQIFAEDITARLQTQSDQSEVAPEAAGDQQIPLTVLNVFCDQAGIILKWELLELVDDILRLYQRTESIVPEVPVEIPRSAPKPEKLSSIHFVLALGEGSISVETVNLKSDTVSNDLKLSVLMTEKQGLTDTNMILACDEVTTKLRSHQQALINFRLWGPSVFVSHELQMQDVTSMHTIKATASSEDLKLNVKQDPMVLTEVLDTLIQDEVAQLYQLQKQFPTSSPPQKQSSNISERLSSFRVNLALFLNHYTISLPLLRSLTYAISGVTARAAMAANFGKELIFDFDIKENSHDMQITVNNTPRSISLLQIPPTNGQITSHIGQGEHSVTVFASVELVQLDASAVYSLLRALNRPEMSNAINDIQQQVKVIQEHVQEIFGTSAKTRVVSQNPEEKEVIYTIHTTLAGIEIFGDAKTKSDSAPRAHLSFCLDKIHLEMANRLDRGPVLENPEVRINLRQIMFDIGKGSDEAMRSCGSLSFGALITASTREAEDGSEWRSFDFKSDGFEVNLSAETVSTFVDVIGYMGDKIKDLDTTREIEYLQKRLRQTRPRIAINDQEEEEETESDIFDSFFASIMYSVEIRNIQVCWLVAPGMDYAPGQEDLVLSFQRIEFATKKKNAAKLTFEKFQLQMVPPGQDKIQRSANSALLPEVVFNIAFVSTLDTRRLAFQAVGKSLDLRLTSGFIVPAASLNNSISLSAKNVQQASEHWTPIVVTEKPIQKPAEARQRSLFGRKRLESLLIDADFAGAVVFLSSRKPIEELESLGASRANRPALAGKYGQFSADDAGGGSTVLRTPGLAWKAEYRDDLKDDPAVYVEIKVDASRNILYPTVVPLIMDITSSIKEVVGDQGRESPTGPGTPTSSQTKTKSAEEDNILTTDPSAVLGKTKLNLGLRICRQEFTLSCQPIARVAATACFEDIYITANTVQSSDHGNFFAISGTFTKFKTAVQHVYSRESTGSFEVDETVLSLMNSKHVSGTSGVSAILKVSPMRVDVNAKQLQDFLLFREIWIPREITQGSAAPVSKSQTEAMAQGQFMQRYQQVAATAAFPWTATISISALDVHVDLGQSIGKATFAISDFWISSKKTSDWEQNLCLGFQKIGIDCNGRLSGFVALQNFKLRTSIEWPDRVAALNETPRVQASIGFGQFRLKAAFDYQAFLVADITSIEFLMYNVRRKREEGSGDRLVAFFDGDAIQVFGTTTSAAQGVALWQAIQRLIQERRANFESSLRDIEKFMKRKSLTNQGALQHISLSKPDTEVAPLKSPISLDTDVVVTLKALNLGVFPSTFADHQVFKLEALNAQARFAASVDQPGELGQSRIHSILGLTLGQLRIGLAGVRRASAPKAASDLDVDDVVASATGSRGGTILKVPKVEAVMQTWQSPESRSIDYIFKSAFEGKVEVGWNYSRVSYIRGMWANHSKTLAAAWGKELPGISAIRVTGVPEASSSADDDNKDKDGGKEQQTKITAEVNVPQSKYEYVALEPPVIETPQLRDMGEATPPLEWIGLHRDRLPNLTHQIVIVSLLEFAGEVEDAYGRILGSS